MGQGGLLVRRPEVGLGEIAIDVSEPRLPTTRPVFWRWSRNGEAAGSISARAQPGCVVLSYRHRRSDFEEWQSVEYPISLEWTRCNYGGERA